MGYSLVSFEDGKYFGANVSGMQVVREVLQDGGFDFRQSQRRWTLDDFVAGGRCEKCKGLPKGEPAGRKVSIGMVLSANNAELVTEKESRDMARATEKWLKTHSHSEDRSFVRLFYRFVKDASTRGGFFVL